MTRSLAVIAALACLQVGVAHAQDYIFTDITDPNANGSTVASGINSSGQVSGYYLADDGTTESFTYQGGVFSEITPTANSSFQANGISDAGTVVGTLSNGSGSYGVIGGNIISAAGFVGETTLNGITGDGTVAVGSVTDTTSHGYAVSFAGITFDFPSSTRTVANGANNSGTIVGYYLDSLLDEHGYTLTGGNYTTINDPLAFYGTDVTGIDSNGDLTGYYVDASFNTEGFIDIDGTFMTIDAPGSDDVDTVVNGINDNGTIVGSFYDTDTDQTIGFEASVPEPASILLLGVSILGLVGLRRGTRGSPLAA